MYAILFLFWLILNGKVNIEIISLGLGVTCLVALFMYGIFRYTPSRDLRYLKKAPVFLAYIGVLSWEILKASLTMVGVVLHAGRSVQPVLVTFDSGLSTETGRFLLANSITLTPGTITVSTEGSVFTVHCLNRSMLDTSEDSTFIRWIRRMEKV